MKKWSEICLDKVFLFALLLLLAANAIAFITEDAVILESTKPLFIPVFLIFYFIKNKLSGLLLILFLCTSFLGDTAFAFIGKNALEKSSNLFYFIGYLCLIFIIISKFDFAKIDKVIAVYLVLMLFINAYFLFTLYSVLKANIADNDEVLVFALKSASIITLLFVSFGVYLAKESKASILFLILGLCFFFSDILNYINIYYIYDWRFVMLDRVLHALGLFFLFNYIVESNKTEKKVILKEAVVLREYIGLNSK